MFNFFKKIFFSLSSWIRKNPALAVLCLYGILSLLVIRGLIFDFGTIGLRHDWSIPSTVRENKLFVEQAFYPWIESRGGYPMAYWSDLVIRFTIGWLPFLGFDGWFISRMYILLSIIGAGFFSYLMLKKMGGNNISSLAGSLIYAFNPLMFNKIISGHIYYLAAYALSPLFLYLWYLTFSVNGYEIKNKKYWLMIVFAGLIYAFCGAQIQFTILLTIMALAITIIYGFSIKKSLINLAIIYFISFGIHLPWLIVLFISTFKYQNPIGVAPSTFSWFVYNSSQVYQSLLMIGGATDYFTRSLKDTLGLIVWETGAATILLTIVFSLLFKPSKEYKKMLLFLLIVTGVLSIFRVWPEFSFDLFKKSIIFNIFREIYHASFLTAIIWSWLASYALMFWQQRKTNYYLKIIVSISLLIYCWPFFADGKLLSNLQTYKVDNDFEQLIDSKDRMLYLPGIQPIALGILDYSGYDSSIDYAITDSLSQFSSVATLNEKFNTFFHSQLYFNSSEIAPVIDNYLSIFDVRNILFRLNTKSDLAKYTLLSNYPEKKQLFNNHSLWNVLENYSDLIVKKSNNWQLFDFGNKEKIEYAKPCLSSGNWNDYNDLFKLSGAAECDNVFWAKDSTINSLEDNNIPIIQFNNNWIDYFVKNKDNYLVEPGTFADKVMDPKENWVAGGNVWWYDPNFASYSKLLAFTKAKGAELKIDLNNIKSGDYYLWIDLYNSPTSGKVEIEYADLKKSIDAYKLVRGFEWKEIGEITLQEDEKYLTLKNLEGENAIGLVLFIPKNKYEEQKNSLENEISERNKTIITNSNQTALAPYVVYDFSKEAKFFANFPEFSNYNFEQNKDNLTVEAEFNGKANQDEYASVLYSLKNIDLKNTPIITLNAGVENEEVQFWELGFEIDQDIDQKPDTYIWSRLKNGQQEVNIKEFMANSKDKLDFDQVKIMNIILHPHKEYNVDMSKYANKKYKFYLSDIRFYSENNKLVRLPRQIGQFNAEKLINNPPFTQNNLEKLTNFYNDFPQTQQELIKNDTSLSLNAQFSNKQETTEYGNIIINTNIDLNFFPYFSADLEIENPEIQFYDLAFAIDTNNDDKPEQTIWVDSIIFDKENKKTVFYDVLNLLQQKSLDYSQPRLIYLELLPHRTYELKNDNIPQVKFDISKLNFYHEAAIQNSQLESLPTYKNNIWALEEGEYNLFLNIDSDYQGKIFGSINQNSLEIQTQPNQKNTWVGAGKVKLNKETNELVLITYDKPVAISDIALFKMDGEKSKDAASEIVWKKNNPSNYSADINIDSSQTIVFKETYHPAWQMVAINKASKEKIVIKPKLINGWQQAYLLDKPGDYEITIEYVLTPIYHYCLLISGIFLVLLTTVIIYLKR